MAAFLDVCRYNPTSGGTTDCTYLSAVTGYQSPTAAGVVNTATYRYRAESADLSEWEVGYGAYKHQRANAFDGAFQFCRNDRENQLRANAASCYCRAGG
jgi:hypothetical protein